MSNESNADFIRRKMGVAPKWALETTLNFGKYKGNSLGDIVNFDRNYLCWLESQDWLNSEQKKAIDLVLESI